MKKDIQITNLAMRFYKSDGWDIGTLSQYLIPGGSFAEKSSFGDDYYWVLNVGSRLDVERLMKDDHVGFLVGIQNEDRGKSDLEILHDRNW